MDVGRQDSLFLLATIVLVAAGLSVNIYNVFLREKNLCQAADCVDSQCFLRRAMCGHLIFFVGIILTTNFVSSRENSDYNHLLDIVSFLSAGVIAGYYSYDSSKYSNNIINLTIRINICFQVIFYVLFSSIAFFMARGTSAQKSNFGNVVVPVIMLIVLIANSYYEQANYLTQKEKNEFKVL